MWFLQKKHALRYASTPSDISSKNPDHDLMILATRPVSKHLEERIKAGVNFSFYVGLSQVERERLVSALVKADAQNYTSPNDFIDRNMTFFEAPTADMLKTSSAFRMIKATKEETYDLFIPKLDELRNIPASNWTTDEIRAFTNLIIASQNCKHEDPNVIVSSERQANALRKTWSAFVHGYLRWAVSAGRPGPDGSQTISILGKEETLRRLDNAQKIRIDARIASLAESQGSKSS